jgi:hypothetical protein
VKLSWDASSSSSEPIAGYNIEQAEVARGSHVLLDSLPVITTGYTDSTVTALDLDRCIRCLPALPEV